MKGVTIIYLHALMYLSNYFISIIIIPWLPRQTRSPLDNFTAFSYSPTVYSQYNIICSRKLIMQVKGEITNTERRNRKQL